MAGHDASAADGSDLIKMRRQLISSLNEAAWNRTGGSRHTLITAAPSQPELAGHRTRRPVGGCPACGEALWRTPPKTQTAPAGAYGTRGAVR